MGGQMQFAVKGRPSRLTSKRALVLGVCVVVPLALFVALGIDVRHARVPGWDSAVARFLQDRPVPFPGDVLQAERWASLLLAIPVIVLVRQRRLRPVLLGVGAAGGALALDQLLKPAFLRRSPTDELVQAFPSGHALVSLATAAMLVLLLWPTRWRGLAAVAATAAVLVTGLALVDSDWHSPSDVLGGWCLAISWVSALWFLASVRLGWFRAAQSRQANRPERRPERTSSS
jgi:membrane-associated phospholipid phosphatase